MQPSRLVPGVDVPWVTRWSEEPLGAALPDLELGGRLAVTQVERPGFGRPIYSENHLPRQRRSAMHGLCPMCGEPTAQGDRWSLTGRRVRAGALRREGLAPLVPPEVRDGQMLLNAGSIAPLHKACATRSAGECPHLRGTPSTRLTAFPRRIVLVPLMIEGRPATPGARGLATPPRALPVVSFIQVIGVWD